MVARFACHACNSPIEDDAPHAVVNISPAIGDGDQTFAYFCECVGDLDDHAALREKYKLSGPQPMNAATEEEA